MLSFLSLFQLYCLHMNAWVTHACSANQDQRRASDTLELELQMDHCEQQYGVLRLESQSSGRAVNALD